MAFHAIGMGILARSLPGSLTIWREILTFEIKKYIKKSGKSDYLAGKTTLFQAVFIHLLYTAAPGRFKALGQPGVRPVTPTTGIWLRALSPHIDPKFIGTSFRGITRKASNQATNDHLN